MSADRRPARSSPRCAFALFEESSSIALRTLQGDPVGRRYGIGMTAHDRMRPPMDPGELRRPIPPPRRGVPLEAVVLSAMAIAAVTGFIALGIWQDLAAEHRARLVFAISVVLIGGVASLLVIGPLRMWVRERRWLRAMSAWQESSRGRRMPRVAVADMPADDLRRLAIRTYTRLGYMVADHKDEDVYVRLINPRGQTELLAQWHGPEPAELPVVNSLQLEIKRTRALRGFLWAPSGFTAEARTWAARRPIVLADRDEIGRLLEAAQLH